MGAFHQRNVNARMFGPQGGQGGRQKLGHGRRHHAHGDSSYSASRHGLEFVASTAEVHQQVAGEANHRFAIHRGLHASAGSVEQSNAKGAFEVLQQFGG